MSGISDQLEEALIGSRIDAVEADDSALEEDAVQPLDSYDFIVKLLNLRHDAYPGRDAAGVLPIVVVGHKSMSEDAWNTWVRENGIAHYGAAYTERVIQHGIDLKEMMPTAGFGRQMRLQGQRSADRNYSYLDRAGEILTAIEKWPSIYDAVAEEMAEEEMTLSQFVERVSNLPSPLELGRGAQTTLGDLLLPPGSMVLPGER